MFKFKANKDSIEVFILAVLVLVLLGLSHKISLNDFLVAVIPMLTTILVILIKTTHFIDRIKIISLSMDYLHGKEGVTIEDVLGVLISNKKKMEIQDPEKILLKRLNAMIRDDSYERARKIAEALPTLYYLYGKEIKKIISLKLRDYYDEAHWHDDVRRRTIESFSYFPPKEKKFIIEMLKIRHLDSIYTLLAILEIIFLTNIFNEKERSKLIKDLREIPDCCDQKEMIKVLDSISKFYELLVSRKTSCKNYRSITCRNHYISYSFKNGSLYDKIFIAKNFVSLLGVHSIKCHEGKECLGEECANYVINFFNAAFDTSNHKNIRRAMARENMFFCLLFMVEREKYKNKARDCILKLFGDSDIIIPTTCFDYISRVYDADKQLYAKAIDKCKSSSDANLQKQASHMANVNPQ